MVQLIDSHRQIFQFSSMGGTNPNEFLNTLGKDKDGNGNGDGCIEQIVFDHDPERWVGKQVRVIFKGNEFRGSAPRSTGKQAGPKRCGGGIEGEDGQHHGRWR